MCIVLSSYTPSCKALRKIVLRGGMRFPSLTALFQYIDNLSGGVEVNTSTQPTRLDLHHDGWCSANAQALIAPAIPFLSKQPTQNAP